MTDGTTRVEDEDIVTTWREDAKGLIALTATVRPGRRRDRWRQRRRHRRGRHRRRRRRRRRRHRRHRWRQRRPAGSPRSGAAPGTRRRSSATTGPRPRCCAAGPGPTGSTTCSRWTTSTASCRPPRPGPRRSGWSRTASQRRRPTPARAGWVEFFADLVPTPAGSSSCSMAAPPSCSRACSVWAPLTAFSRELELFLTHPVQVNAYLDSRWRPAGLASITATPTTCSSSRSTAASCGRSGTRPCRFPPPRPPGRRCPPGRVACRGPPGRRRAGRWRLPVCALRVPARVRTTETACCT